MILRLSPKRWDLNLYTSDGTPINLIIPIALARGVSSRTVLHFAPTLNEGDFDTV